MRGISSSSLCLTAQPGCICHHKSRTEVLHILMIFLQHKKLREVYDSSLIAEKETYRCRNRNRKLTVHCVMTFWPISAFEFVRQHRIPYSPERSICDGFVLASMLSCRTSLPHYPRIPSSSMRQSLHSRNSTTTI